MVIGGQAVLLYGEPRLTRDIDITLGIGVEEIERVKSVVSSLKLKPLVSDPDSFAKETMVFPVSDKPSGIRVDFIFSFSPYERQAIGRARPIRLGKSMVKFASIEDVIIHKMLAGRPRDIEDIESIMLINVGIDAQYVEKWLGEFDSSLERRTLSAFRSLVAGLRRPFMDSVKKGLSDAKAGRVIGSATLKKKLGKK